MDQPELTEEASFHWKFLIIFALSLGIGSLIHVTAFSSDTVKPMAKVAVQETQAR